MIPTVIIDDEPRNIKLIRGIIRDHHANLEIAGTTDDLREALPMIEDLKPSLLILDIGFPSGTIFSILEKLTFRDFHVIFVTAHNTYATEAFRQNAVDYILKPVTKEALGQAIKKAEAKIFHKTSPEFERLLELLQSDLRQPGKIPIPSANGFVFINESEIIRCEANGRYSVLHLVGNKKMTVTKTLKEFEGVLNPQLFFRVHHSHIINLTMLKKYFRGEGGKAELTDGSIVDVSSSRKDEFLKILLRRNR